MNPVAFPLVMAAAQAVTHAVDTRLATTTRPGSGSSREALPSRDAATESKSCGRKRECSARDEFVPAERAACSGQGSVNSSASVRNGALLEGSGAGVRGATAASVTAEGGVANAAAPDVGVSGRTNGGISIEGAVREALATILQTVLSQVSELLTGILTGALPRPASAAGEGATGVPSGARNVPSGATSTLSGATGTPRGALASPTNGGTVPSSAPSAPDPTRGGEASRSSTPDSVRGQDATGDRSSLEGGNRASADLLSSFALHVLSGIRSFLSTGIEGVATSDR